MDAKTLLMLDGDGPTSWVGESGPLTVSGRWLMTESGQPWFGVGVSWFTAYQDWLINRPKFDRMLAWAESRRLQWGRVFGMYNGGIGRFIPEDYGSRYFTEWGPFVRCLGDHGLRAEIPVNADCQYPPLSFDPSIWSRIEDEIGGEWNVVLSGGNEAFKNGYDPLELREPSRGVYARCSTGTDALPFVPEWKIAIYETSRNDDFHRHYKDVRDQYMGDNANPAIGQKAHVFACPVLVDEMIGLGDQYESGKTTNDPFKCWTLTAGVKLMGGAGICAHLRTGIFGNPPAPGGLGEQCVEAMVDAGQLPVGANAFDRYERGNQPDQPQNPNLPVLHHDVEPAPTIDYPGNPAGSLRTHAMIKGDVAHVIAPGPGPQYRMTEAHGWKIVQAFQYRDNPSNVAVMGR